MIRTVAVGGSSALCSCIAVHRPFCFPAAQHANMLPAGTAREQMQLDLRTVAVTLGALELIVGLMTIFAGQNYLQSDNGLKRCGI